MDRRTCIGLGFTLIAGRLAAQQPQPLRRIGVLGGGTLPASYFADEIAKYGWVEGRNVIIERRSAEGNPQRAQILAADLVRTDVEVIVAIGAVASLAARDATRTIPIVTTTGDPVLLGLVPNL